MNDRLRSRFLPAVVTALGVMLVAAGLISYTTAESAIDPATPSPTIVAASPSPPEPTPAITLPPLATPNATATPPPSPSPTPPPGDPNRTSTRVVVPALGIDLPVMAGPPGYPPCNVAMYLRELGQPGRDEATYLYAHARTGMFLPILDASRIDNGARMLGMLVQVYTSDNFVWLYEISEVRRHQTTLDDAITAGRDQMWLQTSEGPRGTIPKTQVVAEPVGPPTAVDPAEAQTNPRPVAC